MADITYNIQLSNNQTITIDQNLVQLYPSIQDQLGDLAPGGTVFLNYDDPEALYIVLSTDYLHTGHSPETYIRLIKAIDYLGNDKLLDTTLRTILQWFETPNVLSVLKQNKNEVRRLMGILSDTELWRMLELYHLFQLAYTLDLETLDKPIISDDLNYVMIIPEVIIFNNGIEVFRSTMGEQYRLRLDDISIITNNEDIYTIEPPLNQFRSNIIVRYRMKTPEKIPELIKENIHGNYDRLRLANNGSKYMINSPDFHGNVHYAVRNMIDNSVLIQGLGPSVDILSNFPSPKMQVVVGQDADRLRYFIHTIDGQKITIQKPVIPDMLMGNLPVVAINTIQIPGNYPYTPYSNRINIIFSYSEQIYMEVIFVSNVPDSQFLTLSNIENQVIPEQNYHVRILDTSGNILVEPFITTERPIALSEKYLLTKIVSEEVIQFCNNQISISKSHILVRSMENLKENIMQTIRGQEHNIARNSVTLISVIPGPKDSFLFIYILLQFFPANITVDKILFIKYDLVEYGNMEEFLEDKLK